MQDPPGSDRFVELCFWEVNIPQEYQQSGASHSIRNYTEEFVMSFWKKEHVVWQSGEINMWRKESIMDNQSMSDKFAAVVVALLLILTAWGNATAMLFVAIIGLVVFVLISRRNNTRSGTLVAIVGFILSIVIALVMMLL